MVRRRDCGLMLALLTVSTVAALGQPYIFDTGFEEYAAGSKVMFQVPTYSGSTTGVIVGTSTNGSVIEPYDKVQVVYAINDWCPISAGVIGCPDYVGCLSDAAYEIAIPWATPGDTTLTSGARLTTSQTANLPSPSIHLDGKIRFKMGVVAFSFEGGDFPIGCQDPSGTPSILMCLGIRETGRSLPLGATDTAGGDLEYVYLPSSEVVPMADTDGFIPFPPGGKRFQATTDLWPPEDVVFYSVEFNLATLTSAQIRGFSNNSTLPNTAGNGVLDATAVGHGVNRGVLESIIFTKDPADTTTDYFFIYIDDLEFEASEEDPAPVPTILAPVLRHATTVTVQNVSTNATEVRLIVDNGDDPDQFITTTGVTSVVFTLPHPAIAGDTYTATQTVDGLESVESAPVPVSFPGPVIGLLPKDGDTSVRVTGLDPLAEAVELFIDGNSAGTTVSTNGALTITVPAGGALVMGEAITATQTVGGGISDPSPVAIVTTNGIVELFCDDFEYADQAAFNAVWAPTSGDLQLELSTTLNATPGGGKSAFSSTVGDHRSGLITEFTPTTGSNTHPVVWNLSYWRNATNIRQYAEVRGALQATSPLIALGKTNQIAGSYYSGRVLGYTAVDPNGWLTLSGYGQPTLGAAGWHVLTMVFKASTCDFYVDGNLAALGIPHNAAHAIGTVLIGSGLSSANGAAYYDDVCVEVGALHFNTITPQPPPPPTVVAPIVPGATSVTVINISTNAELVSLHRNGSDTPVVAPIDPMDATTVAFTIPAAISADYYTAKQTVSGVISAHSAQVFVQLPGPTLYKAPAQGENSVRVLALPVGTTLVQVYVDDVLRGSLNPSGADDVVVSLPSFTLTMGQRVTARMVANGISSVDSAPEFVTSDTPGAVLLCDNFDGYADQTAFEVVYERVNYTSSPNETIHILNSESNATPGGVNSVKSLNTAQYRTTPKGNPFPEIKGTNDTPLVFNVSIYDPTGEAGTDEWASIINWTTLGGGTGFFLAEIGMSTPFWTAGTETHYQGRLTPGPGWFMLDDFDGPTRSIGWHAFTFVIKGPLPPATVGHRVDVYVDGLLAGKNIALSADSPVVTPVIGSGQTSDDGAWYDDYCARLGPVEFNSVPALCPTTAGDMDGDGDVDLADVDGYVACIDGPLTTFTAGCGCGDLNGDTVIDLRDYAILQNLLEP